MKRITPEEVLEAYKETGLIPKQREWATVREGKRCGCGLTAVATHKQDINFTMIRTFTSYGEVMSTEKLGLSLKYVYGFIEGFDGYEIDKYACEDKIAGHEDGRAAWEAVKHLAEV